MLRRLRVPNIYFINPNYSTRVEIDSTLREHFETKQYKPRSHPGRSQARFVSVPPDIQKSIQIILQDAGAKSYHKDSIKLNNYLHSRHLPPEDDEIRSKAAKIYENVSKKFYSKVDKKPSHEEEEAYEQKINTTVFNVLKKNVYRWGNISYDKATSLQYLMARAAPEYAILVRIFDEIKRRLPDYKPRSFFDFGSGVGTGTWAVNKFWSGDIFEYFTVDTSNHMNDLARLILCQGRDNVEMPFKAYFQRQFLPASADLKYNIVLSAFSLFEMPNIKSRLETIQKLWNKTEDFLVIVEHGSNEGFQVVNEAREFVLNSSQSEKGYAFAPCPNDNVCPRYLEQKTPCNFLIKYETIPFPLKTEVVADLFSYIILRKGERPADDPKWPRLVRAPIVRSGHTICRLCTAEGELKEIIFSKGKHDVHTYRCARSSNWGDLLPVK